MGDSDSEDIVLLKFLNKSKNRNYLVKESDWSFKDNKKRESEVKQESVETNNQIKK